MYRSGGTPRGNPAVAGAAPGVGCWQKIPPLIGGPTNDAESNALCLEACRQISALAWRAHGDEKEEVVVRQANESGIALARQMGQFETAVEILASSALETLVTVGDYQRADRLLDEAVTAMDETFRPALRQNLAMLRCMAHLHTGDLGRARTCHTELRELSVAGGLHQMPVTPVFHTDNGLFLCQAWLDAIEGRAHDIPATLQRVYDLSLRHGDPETRGQVAASSALVGLFHGPFEGIGRYDQAAQHWRSDGSAQRGPFGSSLRGSAR